MRRQHDRGAAGVELGMLITTVAAVTVAGLALLSEEIGLLFQAATEAIGVG